MVTTRYSTRKFSKFGLIGIDNILNLRTWDPMLDKRTGHNHGQRYNELLTKKQWTFVYIVYRWREDGPQTFPSLSSTLRHYIFLVPLSGGFICSHIYTISVTASCTNSVINYLWSLLPPLSQKNCVLCANLVPPINCSIYQSIVF